MNQLKNDLLTAIEEAERFIKKAHAGTKEVASMDLTRALVDVRKTR